MPPDSKLAIYTSPSSDQTFKLGEKIGRDLKGGELVLLTGSLGAGKTIFTKGVMSALDYDPDEVTSPSFTLVNLYHARLDAYHIDLWRLDEETDAAIAVGLDDILANDKAVVIVEWADRLKRDDFAAETIRVDISGDGDDPRRVEITGSGRYRDKKLTSLG
jgi:tRNA threonylcarbamoyladenosine biosynthesis protein TsaE